LAASAATFAAFALLMMPVLTGPGIINKANAAKVAALAAKGTR